MTSPGWSGAEARAGVRPEHHEAVRLTAVPKGMPAAEMSAAQREQLRALLQVFVGRIPDELAEREAAKFAGDKLRDVYFAWAGGTERGQPHYYRLQASADKREPAADVPSARQGVVAIARNVSAETNATGRLSSRRMNGRAGFGFSNPTGAATAIGRPVVTCANGMLSQWSMPCSLLWAAEGGLVFSDGVRLAGQDCCLGAGGGERTADSLGVEGGFRGAPLGPVGQQRQRLIDPVGLVAVAQD